jgi:Bacterial flagellin N-terminal helical region
MFTFSPLQITLASSVANVQQEIIDVQNQLSSGKKTLNPGENGIVTRLSAKASGYDVAIKNIDAAQNVLKVGQTTLSSMATIATKLSDLATQAAGGGLSDSDLTSLDTTFIKLYNQLKTLANAASVNDSNALLTDTLNVVYDAAGTTLPIDGVDVVANVLLPTNATYLTSTYAPEGVMADTATPLSAHASALVTDMGLVLDAISLGQSNLSAYQTTLSAMSDGATGLSAGLKSTVDTITNIDSTAMQAKLQSLNNQQSIDYYLVSQMNTESAAILAIFR